MHTCSIQLVSCGDCSRKITADIIHSLFGFPETQALDLTGKTPVYIIDSLERTQAIQLGQLLDEYGLEVRLNDTGNFQKIPYTRKTAFMKDGSLRSSVMSLLETMKPVFR